MKLRVLMAVLLAAGLASCASTRDSVARVTPENVTAVVQMRNYTVRIFQAQPMGMRSMHLGMGYFIRINGDQMECNLPYFGRVFAPSAAMFGRGGGGERLNFRGPMEDYIMTREKNGTMNVSFNFRTAADLYRFQLRIRLNGNVDVSVRPRNRQQINFSGDMVL